RYCVFSPRCLFSFHATAPSEIYTLSLHDALPILEPGFGRRWDKQLAAYVSASFRTQNVAALGHECIGLIGKLVNAATLWWGAHLDRKSTRLNSSHVKISYAVFCLKKKKTYKN